MTKIALILLSMLFYLTITNCSLQRRYDDVAVQPVYYDPQEQNRAFSKRNTIRYVMPVVNGRLSPDCPDPYRCKSN